MPWAGLRKPSRNKPSRGSSRRRTSRGSTSASRRRRSRSSVGPRLLRPSRWTRQSPIQTRNSQRGNSQAARRSSGGRGPRRWAVQVAHASGVGGNRSARAWPLSLRRCIPVASLQPSTARALTSIPTEGADLALALALDFAPEVRKPASSSRAALTSALTQALVQAASQAAAVAQLVRRLIFRIQGRTCRSLRASATSTLSLRRTRAIPWRRHLVTPSGQARCRPAGAPRFSRCKTIRTPSRSRCTRIRPRSCRRSRRSQTCLAGSPTRRRTLNQGPLFSPHRFPRLPRLCRCRSVLQRPTTCQMASRFDQSTGPQWQRTRCQRQLRSQRWLPRRTCGRQLWKRWLSSSSSKTRSCPTLARVSCFQRLKTW